MKNQDCHLEQEIKKIKTILQKQEEKISELDKKSNNCLSVPIFVRILMSLFGILLSVWSLVWFGLKLHIKTELLEQKASIEKGIFDLYLNVERLQSIFNERKEKSSKS